MITLPTRLKIAREAHNVTQAKVARTAGVSRGKIIALERHKGQLAKLDLNVLRAYSLTTGLSEMELLFGVDVFKMKHQFLLRVQEMMSINEQQQKRSLELIEEEFTEQLQYLVALRK